MKASSERKITGWIETSVGNRFYGWYDQDECHLDIPKFLHIYLSGELHVSIKIVESRNSRGDLAHMKNFRTFEFDFEEKLFITGCSNCDISFAIYCEPVSHHIKVLPSLTLQACERAGKLSKGLAFGRVSEDKTAVVGAGGNFFLKSGTNQLESLYVKENSIDVEAWYSLFLDRSLRATDRGIQYIQIIIPEKSSVLYWNVPYTATKGSASFAKLIEKIDSNPMLSSCFLKGFDWIPDEVHSEAIFRAYDSHFSTLGTKMLCSAIVSKFFPDHVSSFIPSGIFFGESAGDLGTRFQATDGYVIEKPPLYSEVRGIDGETLTPELVSRVDPEEGNTGTIRVWKCNNAPIKIKVVCFGDSFFERGEVSGSLSWWFARLFSEFHFYWTSEQPIEYIDLIQPQVVISETIERFLRSVPNT